MLNKKRNLFFMLIFASQLNGTSQNNCFPHSISYNAAREIVVAKSAYESSLIGMDHFGSFAIFYDRQKSFKNNKENGLGSLITWSEINKMTAGGTSNDTTGAVSGTEDLDLYQFGLGDRKAGGTATISFTPEVRQEAINLFFSSGYHKHHPGFWMKIQTTAGNIRINPHLSETGELPELKTAGEYYPAGAFDNTTAITSSERFTNLTEAFAHKAQVFSNFKAVFYGKIDGEQSSTAKLGDIIGSIGYNFYANTTNFYGAAFHFIAPTGNKPFNHFAYEPIFGNGGHWGIGAEFNSKTTFWSIEAAHAYIQLWVSGKIRHLFAAEQTRSFDLTDNGPGSRYMLVAKYRNTNTNDSAASVAQFVGQFAPLLHYSTLACQSVIPVEIEAATLLELSAPNFTVGLGYEFWYRSREQLKITGDIHPGLVVIGRQRVKETAHLIPLGFCQPNATMQSQDPASLVADIETDNIKLAGRSSSKVQGVDALNVNAAEALATHSSKFFIDISYKVKQKRHLPHIGIFASVEVGTSKNNSINQWGLGMHTGLAF